MFPHTITIFHHDIIGDDDVYTRCVVSDVYWHGSTGVSPKDKGIESADAVTVITSAETAHQFGDKWNVQCGDRIVNGICGDISSFKELKGKEVITVTGYEKNIVGSDVVDHITITGK